MRHILLLILLYISCLVYSQQYVPLPLQNCFWQMQDAVGCSNSSINPPTYGSSSLIYKLYPTGNVVLSQKTYVAFSKLDIANSYNPNCSYLSPQGNGYQCAIRQDTLNKMIYIRYSNDTVEKTLYNFNYIKGDSVKTVLSEVVGPNGYTARVVDSVYYHTYNDGIARKTFILKPMSLAGIILNDFIIEGIGNETGLLNNRKSLLYGQQFIYYTSETWSSFLSINNFTVSKTPTNTYYNTVSIAEPSPKSNINVFPSPITNILNINSPEFNPETSCYNISDVTGRNIIKGPLSQNSNEVDLSNLTSGIYFAKININDSIVNYKIIKQ